MAAFRSNKQRGARIIGYVSLSIFLIFCCFSLFRQTSGKEQNQGKNMMKFSFTHDPSTLDPRKSSDVVGSIVAFALFDGLTKMDKQSTHEPALAKKIDISDDKTVYTFTLRDANWSNGDPITAHDFDYTWRSILEPKFPAPNAHLLYPIKNAEAVKKGEIPADQLGLEVVNDKTLVVTLERPTPYFLDLTSFCVLFPVPSKIVKNNPKWADDLNEDFVSNGAFVLDQWKHTDQLVFRKNNQFWDKSKVKLEGMNAIILDNEITALGMFEKGEIDFMGGCFANIQTEWIPDLERKSKLKYHPFGATKFVTFNNDAFPFNNVNIRKAFSHAINRQSLIDNITQYKEEPAFGYVPPLLKNGRSKRYFSDGNLEVAREYMQKGLKELGLSSPKELGEICYNYFNANLEKNLALALQQQWNKAFGIQVRLNETEFNVHMDKLNRRQYQFGQFMYIAQYNDQMNILDRFKAKSNLKNYPGWENPEFIHLLDSTAYAKDSEERLQIFEQAEQVMLDDMPLAGLFHWGNIMMESDRVQDFFISPVGSAHFNNAYLD